MFEGSGRTRRLTVGRHALVFPVPSTGRVRRRNSVRSGASAPFISSLLVLGSISLDFYKVLYSLIQLSFHSQNISLRVKLQGMGCCRSFPSDWRVWFKSPTKKKGSALGSVHFSAGWAKNDLDSGCSSVNLNGRLVLTKIAKHPHREFTQSNLCNIYNFFKTRQKGEKMKLNTQCPILLDHTY